MAKKVRRGSGLVIVHHPRSPDASLERLRALAGIISLQHEIMTPRFLEEDEPEPQSERDSD